MGRLLDEAADPEPRRDSTHARAARRQGPRRRRGHGDRGAPTPAVAPQGSFCEFSPDGSRLARTGGSVAGVEIVPTDNAERGAAAAAVTISGVASGRVQKLAWSPQGTYLVTWQKFDTAANFPNVPAALLNAVPGTFDEPGSSEAAAAEESRGSPRSATSASGRRRRARWWTLDEEDELHDLARAAVDRRRVLVPRMVTNEVLVYRGGGGTNRGQPGIEGGFLDKIRLPNVASFSVSPSPTLPVKVAMFVPESGKPANVQIFPSGAKDLTARCGQELLQRPGDRHGLVAQRRGRARQDAHRRGR